MGSNIVQFICFITKLEIEDFVPEWENYSGEIHQVHPKPNLHEMLPTTSGKFRYISLHPCDEDDFQFSFVKQRISKHFPNHEIRVFHAGGYLPLQMQKKIQVKRDEVKLFACLSHHESDLEFYKALPFYRHLNIYQAYYESCSYGYILEFFVPEANVQVLRQSVKKRLDTEIGIYKELEKVH